MPYARSMAEYFFYGTLMDPEVAREILGRPLSGCSPVHGVLKGYKRVCVADATYPAITPAPDDQVDGIVVSRITELEAFRLKRYEGIHYDMLSLSIKVSDGMMEGVRVFTPLETLPLTDQPWDFKRWQVEDKKRFLKAVQRNTLV